MFLLSDLVLLALATWRVSSLLASEDGPYRILARLRHMLGVRYDEHSLPYGTTELAKMVACIWCNSVWVGAVAALSYALWPAVVPWLCLPLALSAAAVLLHRAAGGE